MKESDAAYSIKTELPLVNLLKYSALRYAAVQAKRAKMWLIILLLNRTPDYIAARVSRS